MNRPVRWSWILLLAVLLAAPAGPVGADPGIAWRLSLLKSITRPVSRSPAGPDARIDRAIREAARLYRVDEALIRAVIREESAYDRFAVSSAGAMGLMQLMPATARELDVARPFDARENVLGGTDYLRRMFDRFGSWELAVTAYHAGPERVAESRVGPKSRRYTRRVMARWERSRSAP